MKEIQTVYVGGMNNAAHFMFVSNMAERAENDPAVSEKCAAQVKALRAAVQAEDENLQTSAKSLTTDKIAAADRLRDQLYAGYKKAVAGYASFPVENMAEAAKVLQQHSCASEGLCLHLLPAPEKKFAPGRALCYSIGEEYSAILRIRLFLRIAGQLYKSKAETGEKGTSHATDHPARGVRSGRGRDAENLCALCHRNARKLGIRAAAP